MLQVQASTIVFQILNFLILLAGLGYFLYRPLLQVMQRREASIAARIQESEERAAQAESARQQLATATAEARAAADGLLTEARAEAARERETLIEQAKDEARKHVAAAQQQIHAQEEQALHALDQRATAAATRIAGEIVRNAAGPLVHQALLDQLLQQAPASLAPRAAELRAAIAGPPDADGHTPVAIELAYPPTEQLRARIVDVLASALGVTRDDLHLDFRVEPTLIAGARLLVGTVAIDLSLRRTLNDLTRPARGE